MCKQYNGFTNRETWLVGVHGFFHHNDIVEAVEDAIEQDLHKSYIIADYPDLGGIPRALTLYLADWMENYFDDYLQECLGDNLPLIVTDLMGDHRINWLEIAEHYSELEEIVDVLQEVTA